jgi:hypothetical protein
MPADLSFSPDNRTEEQYAADRDREVAAAMRREYAGYVQRGLTVRAEAVNEAHRKLFGEPLVTVVEQKPTRTARGPAAERR